VDFSITCGVATGGAAGGPEVGTAGGVVAGVAGGVVSGVAGVVVSAGLAGGGVVEAHPPGAHADNPNPSISIMVTGIIDDLLICIVQSPPCQLNQSPHSIMYSPGRVN